MYLTSTEALELFPDCLKVKLFTSSPLFVTFYDRQEILGANIPMGQMSPSGTPMVVGENHLTPGFRLGWKLPAPKKKMLNMNQLLAMGQLASSLAILTGLQALKSQVNPYICDFCSEFRANSAKCAVWVWAIPIIYRMQSADCSWTIANGVSIYHWQ